MSHKFEHLVFNIKRYGQIILGILLIQIAMLDIFRYGANGKVGDLYLFIGCIIFAISNLFFGIGNLINAKPTWLVQYKTNNEEWLTSRIYYFDHDEEAATNFARKMSNHIHKTFRVAEYWNDNYLFPRKIIKDGKITEEI